MYVAVGGGSSHLLPVLGRRLSLRSDRIDGTSIVAKKESKPRPTEVVNRLRVQGACHRGH